jgi:hypothetical protein
MKKITFVLLTFLFSISSVFSNDGIFFYENELFTVVNSGTVNFGSAVFTQGGTIETSRTSIISKCGSIVVAETTGVLPLDAPAVLGTTDAAINPTTTINFPVTVNRNPNLTLATNGVNCLCENAAVGDAGSLATNGKQKRFTKSTVAERNVLINTEQIFSYRRLCTKK